jgi:hypothetical protein
MSGNREERLCVYSKYFMGIPCSSRMRVSFTGRNLIGYEPWQVVIFSACFFPVTKGTLAG